MENAFILRGSADRICLKTIRKRFLPVGPLFYCDDVIGVVVSGFNRGSTLEYPAPYIDRWKSARDYDKLAEAYVNDESEPDDKRFRC